MGIFWIIKRSFCVKFQAVLLRVSHDGGGVDLNMNTVKGCLNGKGRGDN